MTQRNSNADASVTACLVAFDVFSATGVQVKPSETSPHSPSAEMQHPDHPLGHLRSSRLPAMHAPLWSHRHEWETSCLQANDR